MSETGVQFTMGPALLFCPADRPERYEKALARADAVILDLEDAVAPADKDAARRALVDSAATLDPTRVIVRVNAADTEHFTADLAAVRATPFRTAMLAKAEDPDPFDMLPDGVAGIALCETARGIVAAERIAAHPRVRALFWGAEDLVASLGGTSSRRLDGSYRDVARQARARVLLAAGAHGKAAIDSVHLDIADLDGLAEEAADAVASGFAATACIHPGQVETIRAAYLPDADAVREARALLDAASGERGVFRFEGRMIDEPVLRHARSVLARAEA
ncbi:CoA ester lyase [Microbacterium pseudoresistens]|uniref:Citrate lyase subunit beta/citryl-CoA lyase n=1 Tax=Microbacterium pseudoresistens TaxID=640634 RepID=A0A7Y9JQ71_9MICO|nr:CoA ester lyase [Microbacterium pseudoresistens]NYD55404.1 citrate lyase subunit beta/citryl-CoA lyase [Microbacterium pseudoresistens]